MKKDSKHESKILTDIKETADMDEKAPASSRVSNAISMAAAATSALVFVVFILVFLIAADSQSAQVLNAFNVIFFVEVALIIFSAVLAVRELCRNIFLSSILSLGMCVLVIACIVIFMVSAYSQYNYILLSSL